MHFIPYFLSKQVSLIHFVNIPGKQTKIVHAMAVVKAVISFYRSGEG